MYTTSKPFTNVKKFKFYNFNIVHKIVNVFKKINKKLFLISMITNVKLKNCSQHCS